MNNTCGKCAHAKMTPDLKMRVCYGGPPQIVWMVGPQGQAGLHSMRPNVRVEEEACSMFKPVFVLDMSNVEDVAKVTPPQAFGG